LLLGFALPIGLCCHVDGIRILGIHFGSNYLSPSYLQDDLNEDVHHANAFPRLGDVLVAFGIFSWCFVQRPSICSVTTPPHLGFECQLDIFYSIALGVFERLLRLGSLECF